MTGLPVVLLATLLPLAPPGEAPPPGRHEPFGPWSVHPAHPANLAPAPRRAAEANRPAAGRSSSVVSLSYLVWTELLSPMDGPRCPHRPTCAAYAQQAISEVGILFGIILVVDRLLHEESPVIDWPVVRDRGGRPWLADPVSENILDPCREEP